MSSGRGASPALKPKTISKKDDPGRIYGGGGDVGGYPFPIPTEEKTAAFDV